MTTTITAINACNATIKIDNAAGTLTNISGSIIKSSLRVESELGVFKVFDDSWHYRLEGGRNWEATIDALYTMSASEGFALLRDWWLGNRGTRTLSISDGTNTYLGEVVIQSITIEKPADDATPVRAVVKLLGHGAIDIERARMFCATATLGLYYCSDVDASPLVWTSVNDGLTDTDMRVFDADRIAPLTCQYALLTATNAIWRRYNSGDWESSLTQAQARALVGETVGEIGWVTADRSVAGRVYALFATGIKTGGTFGLLTSDDYGATWAVCGAFINATLQYGNGNIIADGNTVWLSKNRNAASITGIYKSVNRCTSWRLITLGSSGFDPMMSAAPGSVQNVYCHLSDDDLYLITDPDGSSPLTSTVLQDALNLAYYREDAMWHDPSDTDHQRILQASKLFVTNDAWANVVSATPSAISPTVNAIRTKSSDNDFIIYGRTGTLLVGNPHVVMRATSETDVAPTGFAGSSAGASPFTDSIPYTCGGLSQKGMFIFTA